MKICPKEFADWRRLFLSGMADRVEHSCVVSDAKLMRRYRACKSTRANPYRTGYDYGHSWFEKEHCDAEEARERRRLAQCCDNDPSDEELNAYYARIEKENAA